MAHYHESMKQLDNTNTKSTDDIKLSKLYYQILRQYLPNPERMRVLYFLSMLFIVSIPSISTQENEETYVQAQRQVIKESMKGCVIDFLIFFSFFPRGMYPLSLDYQLAKNRARQFLRTPSYQAYTKDTKRILHHLLNTIRLVYIMKNENQLFLGTRMIEVPIKIDQK